MVTREDIESFLLRMEESAEEVQPGMWVVGADGQALRQLPDVLNDDASIAWSPDASQLLVYGGWGGQLVEVSTGAFVSLPFLAGYGSIAWLPD